MRLRNWYTPLLLILLPHFLWSQQIVCNAGDFFTSPSGSLSFTMSDIIVETAILPTGTLTQGFQQTYPSSAGVDEQEQGFFSFYPNPANETIKVRLDRFDVEKLHLLDCSGRLVGEWSISTNQIQDIDIRFLSNGIYHLNVFDQDHNSYFMGILLKN